LDVSQGFRHPFLGELLVVVSLEVEPHLGRPLEILFEAQGGIYRDGTLALHDLIDAARRDSNIFRHAIFGQAKWKEKVLTEDFAGMDGGMCFHGRFVSVVVDDLNLVRAVRFPLEADAPLAIDADGVLAFHLSFKGFQAVAGRDG